MKALKFSLLAVVLGTGLARAALAANYSITASVSAAYDQNFQALPSIPDYSHPLDAPAIFRIDFNLQASGFNAAANQRGFGNILFDINFSGDSIAPAASFPNWYAVNPQVDTNGAASGGLMNLWFANEDTGSAVNGTNADLKNILLDLDVIPSPNPEDPRPHVGEGAGTAIGSIYAYWDGTGPESLSVNVVTSSSLKQISFARIDDGDTQIDTAAVFTGSTIDFGNIPLPPPTTGDFDMDGDIDGADFVIWQTHFPTAAGATVQTGDGNSDQVVDGADFAIWNNAFTAANSPVAAVPEPATCILLSLGGFWAFVRRASSHSRSR